MANSSSHNLLEALKALLVSRQASTQEDICQLLEAQGLEVNQSKVSRLLRKVGAIKVVNLQGETVYSLPKEPAPPSLDTSLKELIFDIVANEVMVVIFASPGSASMIGRVLDYHESTTEILATIAGDDTVFVVPKSIQRIHILLEQIKRLLQD